MPLPSNEFDQIEQDRVSEIMSKVYDGDDKEFEKLFRSERIHDEVFDEKVILNSFNISDIIAYLPYHSKIYVEICPKCVNNAEISQFKTLISTGSIVPILPSSYGYYRSEIVDLIISHDHMSANEFHSFRSIFAYDDSTSGICEHCLDVKRQNILKQLKRNKKFSLDSRDIEAAINNLYPFMDPDFHLLDELYSAVTKKDSDYADAIFELSWIVNRSRSAKAFNAPVIIRSTDFLDMPTSISDDIDVAIETSKTLERKIAEGLGIRVPEDIPLEQYIEICSDYRPRIEKIVDTVKQSNSESHSENFFVSEIMNINRDIQRIEKSRRSIILDAAVDFYKTNSTLINASITAGALGLTNGLAGCAGGIITGGLSLAKKKGWVGGGPASTRFERMAQNVTRPLVDSLVSKYLGSTNLAVNVLSIRRDINNEYRKTLSPKLKK